MAESSKPWKIISVFVAGFCLYTLFLPSWSPAKTETKKSKRTNSLPTRNHSDSTLQSNSDTDSDKRSSVIKGLTALGYITWWSLDATGYHPSVLVKIQNESGTDLSGESIRFQGRFMDLRFGGVTVGRTEVKQSFGSHKIIYVLLRGRQPFELSRDINEWPTLECKIMCRVGKVEDEGTQTLLITKVDTITMTDDDAFYKINRMPDVQDHGSDFSR